MREVMRIDTKLDRLQFLAMGKGYCDACSEINTLCKDRVNAAITCGDLVSAEAYLDIMKLVAELLGSKAKELKDAE